MSAPSPVAPPPGPHRGPPNRHKMALLTWMGIYPLITTLLLVLGPFLLGKLPVPAVTLILTGILVPTMTYVVMPLMLKVTGDWVFK
jgi:antibiotic biosynthesis monooxygenase (ABM) superfamily enzyme